MITIQELINWYLNQKYDTVVKINAGFNTVYNCAYGHYERELPNGRVQLICDEHQRRVGNINLAMFAENVVQKKSKWSTAKSFEELKTKIAQCKQGVNRIGELAIYDCAARLTLLAPYRHLQPKELVYIHAGVYKGAMWMYQQDYIQQKPSKNKTLHIELFDRDLFRLLFERASEDQLSYSIILESFLCHIAKSDSPIHIQK